MNTTQDHTYPPANYAAYLASALWREIKARVLDRDGRMCFFCGGAADVVHHRSYAREVLEGNADHLLVSLCNVCHAHIHFDQAGAWLSPQVTDAVLLTRAGRQDFPRRRFDPRRRLGSQRPKEWPTMNAAQRAGWIAWFSEMYAQYWQAKRDREQAAIERKASRPPVDPGWTRLDDAVREHKGAMPNRYDSYRHNAKELGAVRIGTTEIRAEKRGGTWCIPTADLAVAIEQICTARKESVVMGMPPEDH